MVFKQILTIFLYHFKILSCVKLLSRLRIFSFPEFLLVFRASEID